MRFCDVCADLRLWPHTFTKIVAECELCQIVKPCNDVPESGLPRTELLDLMPIIESEPHS